MSWKPVAGASYYNLILWRGSRRILDVWPESPRAALPTTWRSGRVTQSLAPGRYFWFAYPGIGPKSESRYSTPVRSGVLLVSDRK